MTSAQDPGSPHSRMRQTDGRWTTVSAAHCKYLMSPFDHFGAKKEMDGGIGMSSSIGFPLQCAILDEWTNFSAVRGVACRSNKMKLWTNNQLLLLYMPIMYYVCRWQIALLRMQCRAQSPTYM